jgi:hypothetical protein
MHLRARPFTGLLLALALVGLTPSCLLLHWNNGPVPTLDEAESPELLLGTSGTIVVAEARSHLSVVSLPSGATREIATSGPALVASAMDDQARVVYVRGHRPWFQLGLGDSIYTLVLKSLESGVERELGIVGRGNRDARSEFKVSLAAGRALCSFRDRAPQVFEVAGGVPLELSWWDRRIVARGLSRDGSCVLAMTHDEISNGPTRWKLLAVDLETHGAVASRRGGVYRRIAPVVQRHC